MNYLNFILRGIKTLIINKCILICSGIVGAVCLAAVPQNANFT